VHDGAMDDTTPATSVADSILTVRRAFGEPVERGGVTVVPVARVVGGAGSGYGTGHTGSGRSDESEGSGGGGGFGVHVRPLGVYVVTEDRVRWEPVLDLQRVVLGGQVVGAVAVIALAWASRRRRR
jgi:uncharacterized spore protein YtfJ